MDKVAEIERCLTGDATRDGLSVGETATTLGVTFQLAAAVFMWVLQGGDRPTACIACGGTGNDQRVLMAGKRCAQGRGAALSVSTVGSGWGELFACPSNARPHVTLI